MRFSVWKSGRLALTGTPKATIEEALDKAEDLIATKAEGERVRLEDNLSGKIYDENGIAELREMLND